MAQTIRIKRSTGSAAPSSLYNAELAYSEGGDGSLYIGVGTGGGGGTASSIVQIGGAAVASAITTARAAGYVFAGPSSGSNAAPTWRALTANDIPDISSTYLTVSTAGSTYLTQSSASSTYLSQSTASSTYAPLASPALSGTPTAPTAASNTNSTQIATTAFVQAVVSAATPTGVAYLAQANTFASGQTQTFAGTLDVTGTLKISGTTVSATAAELNLLNTAAANTVVNSKAVVYGSSGEIAASSISTTGNVTVGGNLVVQGTTTTIESSTLSVADKAIELAKVASPTDTTADGAGIIVKGASDKTWTWADSTDAWTSSEHIDLATGKAVYINGTQVLSSSTLGSGVTASSLTSVGTLTSGSLGTGFTAVAVAQGGTGLTSAVSGLLKGSSGSYSAAVAGTDYQAAITASGVLKGDGSGGVSAAVAGTDYLSPSSDIDGGSY